MNTQSDRSEPATDRRRRGSSTPGVSWRAGRSTVAALAVVALVAAGCGDDDDDEAGAAATTYCDAALASETFAFPDLDHEASPEELSASLEEVAVEYRPVLDAVLDAAPDEVRADGETLIAAFEDMVETGDLSTFDDPDVVAAGERVHDFDLENCDWNAVEVTAKEYEFAGLPDTIPAGPASFEFTNSGDEIHHMIVVRFNDDVTMSVDDLLELDEEEAGEFVTFPVEEPFALPGESDYSVAELTPGRYAVVCFIPVGTTSFDSPEGGAPHFTQGMLDEFTVG